MAKAEPAPKQVPKRETAYGGLPFGLVSIKRCSSPSRTPTKPQSSEASAVWKGGARERREKSGAPIRERPVLSGADFAPTWSECGDSNPGPPAPKAGALPTAQHPGREPDQAASASLSGSFPIIHIFRQMSNVPRNVSHRFSKTSTISAVSWFG